MPLGKTLRYFGDGFQTSKQIGGKRYWRVPVMDGEFLVQDTARMVKAVGGGNFLVLADTQVQALEACEAAIVDMRKLPEIVMPFPGGVVRSGSKVGSKYKALSASTNDAFCPTLRGATKSELDERIGAVLEIVIDGLTESDVAAAMRAYLDSFDERVTGRADALSGTLDKRLMQFEDLLGVRVTDLANTLNDGGNDIVALLFNLDLNTITYFMRAAVFALPPLAFILTRRWCISLQRQDAEKLLHGYETGVIMRSPEGGYSERHLPISVDAAYTLTAGQHIDALFASVILQRAVARSAVARDADDGSGLAGTAQVLGGRRSTVGAYGRPVVPSREPPRRECGTGRGT